MNPIDLLWKVLRATTNSPNDVWKPRHYERHDNVPEELLGTQINRYTVPIQHIAETKYGNIYLVIQFCTDYLDMPCFAIPRNAFTNDLKAEEEFVYAINVRLCFEDEFKTHRKRPSISGEIKKEYRKEILINALGLIHDTERRKTIISFIKNKNYLNMTKSQLDWIVNVSQFDYDEKIYKGLDAAENKEK